MLRILRLLWATLGDYYYDIVPLTSINILWLVCILGAPLIGGAILRAVPSAFALLPVLVVSVVATPPAIAGVFHAGRRFADGESVGPRDFVEGFLRYFWRSWQLALVDAAAGGIVVLNIWFYWNHGGSALKLVALLFLYAVAFWVMLQPYLFGLLIFQQDKRLGNTVRNAALLVMANLGHSIAQVVGGALFLVLSVGLGLPFVILTGIVGAIWYTRTLDILLAKYPGTRRADPTPPPAPEEPAMASRPVRR